MTRWLVWIVLAGALPVPAGAQQDSVPPPAPTATLTLQEALDEARRSSPAFRQVLNDAGPARWAVRNAYASFLPTVSASAGFGYTGSGQQVFGGTFFSQSSPSYNSDYSLGLRWDLNGRVLTGPAQQKANQRATAEEINAAEMALRADVTTQYLTALQTVAQVAVARQQLQRNEEFLELARARYEVGQGTLLDVRQAEAQRGTAAVGVLRAEQADNEAKLELLRRMGVVPPVPVEQIALTDSFPVSEPTFNLDELLQLAEDQNPSLRALRAREHAAGAAVTAARSEYLPTLSLQAGWSGFTQEFTDEGLLLSESRRSAQQQAADCQFNNQVREGLNLGGVNPDCFGSAGLNATGTDLLDPVARRIRAQNDVFPFDYAGQPFRANLTLSLPIFTGLGRSLRVSQARAQQQDADESVRARALQVRTDVNARYLAVRTAYRAIAVQATAREAARDQLRLAQDRYRLGSGTAIELADAQSAVAQAEGDYVNAVYAYHIAVAALEAAVGRPLR